MTQHNLPAPATSFVGRTQEIAENIAFLRQENCRLLTLLGTGGVGKTRLAIEVAQRVINAFPDGVFFVPLQALQTEEFIVPAVADTLDLTLQGQDHPHKQLCDALHDRHLLLVMDNFEHLLEGVSLIADILKTAPDVTILVTSRVTLNLQEEWVRPIDGMPLPEQDGIADIENYAAIQLFYERARQVRPDFSIAEQARHVIQICRLVDGVPLAIELAASWSKALPCEQIHHEISQNLDFLSSNFRNIPERHRSIRAVFNHSWHLLSATEQTVFSRLSVFSGGFTLEAVIAVAGASLHDLSSLVEQSMVQLDAAGRYQLHELVRQYAAEKLAEAPDDERATLRRHRQYYLGWLYQIGDRLKGVQHNAVLDEIECEIDNIRIAWEQAAVNNLHSELGQALESLVLYYMIYSRFLEGDHVLGTTLEHLTDLDQALEAQILLFLARILYAYDWDTSVKFVRRGVALWLEYGAPGEATFALALHSEMLCMLYRDDAKISAALLELYQTNLATCRKTGDQWAAGWAALSLADYFSLQEKDANQQAERLLYESRSHFDAIGASWAATHSMGHLDRLLVDDNKFAEALALNQERQAIFMAIGDLQGVVFTHWRQAVILYEQDRHQDMALLIREALTIVFDLGIPKNWSLVFSVSAVHTLIKKGNLIQAFELAVLAEATLSAIETQLVHYMHALVVDRLTLQIRELEAELPAPVVEKTRSRIRHIDPTIALVELMRALFIDDSHSEDAGTAVKMQPLDDPLSKRELEVLELLDKGLSNREIAQALVVSVGTVKTHAHHIYQKLGVSGRAKAVARARELGLL